MSTTVIEEQRLALQRELDAERTSLERNQLGQYATPSALADDILTYARKLYPDSEPVRFLEPALGSGSFFSALLRAFPQSQIEAAQGFEVDPRFAQAARDLWQDTPLEVNLEDFTQAEAPWLESEKVNLVITNPPYVRHHHLGALDKERLQHRVEGQTGYRLSRLAGLYCHFLLLSHAWMTRDALACWLIPSEFMDVNYGQAIKQYLLRDVKLLRIHRYDEHDSQFDDALVSSAVVWFRRVKPPPDHQVEFTHGGTLMKPNRIRNVPHRELDSDRKWTVYGRAVKSSTSLRGPGHTPLGDLFSIKRGLATGDNGFFILNKERAEHWGLPQEILTPILPSPRHLKVDHIETDVDGIPLLDEPLFLFDCRLTEEVIKERHPNAWRYLQHGRGQGVHERYLCRNRDPWYAQEKRPAPPILCTYMGRSRTKASKPFRFIRNHSRATAANSYLLLYPKPEFKVAVTSEIITLDSVWRTLNEVSPSELINEGRVYGGGLHKLEPRELAQVSIPMQSQY